MIRNRVIPILWGHKHRELDYTLDVFKDTNQESSWIGSGHQPSTLTIGLHAMSRPYEWMDYLADHFPDLENISYSFSRFSPGTYFPMHFDRYGFYSKQNNLTDLSCIRRYILFLEDAEPGHFLQVGDHMYYNWPAGLCVGWKNDEWHLAANLGLSNRYTLQITGMLRSAQHG